ncbi:MAG: SDR family NAD(P)-dependent oxidoreductase [Litorimonas sp.]
MARTIFITDATSLLGKACAIRLGRAGWNIVMGASSLSTLEDVCNELPDYATCAHRCVPSDIGNILPVFEDGVRKFGSIDAVLVNYRSQPSKSTEALDEYISGLTNMSKVARPFLDESQGQFIIVGQRRGKVTMAGAMQTMARNASRTLSDALLEEWREDAIRVALVEPDGLDGPKPMARRIARVLNGAPPRRPVASSQTISPADVATF